MAKVKFSEALRAEYERLFDGAELRPERFSEADEAVDAVVAQKTRYEAVVLGTKVPWYVVGAIHRLECSGSFSSHLHNGDPLTKRTVRVPAGRPPKGKPPFAWEDSAKDALALTGFFAVPEWTVGRLLYAVEGYNGWGYRLYHPEVLSPYLWAGTQWYSRGKYVQDGRFSAKAVSRQLGVAALLRRAVERGFLPDLASKGPSVSGPVPEIAYAMVKVAGADALQRYLNTLPGIVLRVDSIPGPKTSDAFHRVFGRYLPGDPREKKKAA